MEILITHKPEENGIGGGNSFLLNLEKGMKAYKDVEISYDQDCKDYDLLLVMSVTSMKNPDLPDQAKQQGKKVVLRVDNMPKQSRNRENVFKRLERYVGLADEVIYQSLWAYNFIAWGTIQVKGTVILNGVDQEIYNKTGERDDFSGGIAGRDIYLYSQSSSDPCKRPDEAFYIFGQKHREFLEGKRRLKPRLIIAGRMFDQKLIDGGFDFTRGEDYLYLGEIHSRDEMAKIYRSCTGLLFPSYNDACPNTILEARACGIKDIYASPTGGTQEAIGLAGHKLGIDRMCDEYYKLFNRLINGGW